MATIAGAVAPACSSAIASASRSSFSASSRGLSLGRPLRVSISGSGLKASPRHVRAATSTDEASTTSTTTSVQTEELIADLKAKWDSIEDKTNLLVYGGGALVAVWLSSTIVGAVNSVPLLPKVLELVGLGYTGWFVYKYLLFKESRKELVRDIEELKSKIAGGAKE
ncbi:hypothetical protein GOP47_0026629 [Adiantum capillus-veneris]|nr:hypothetical protein GOP47_0026629 [Adiantum capillus-veneris]